PSPGRRGTATPSSGSPRSRPPARLQRRSSSPSLRSLLSFGFALECLEPLVPERLEEGLELRQSLRPGPVEPLRAVPSLGHQTRLLQDAQVLRDRGPRDVELRCDLPRRELAVADERQDLPPPRRCDRLQRG